MIVSNQPKGVSLGGAKKLLIIPLLLTFFLIPSVSAATPISSDPITLPVFLVICGICLALLLIGLGFNIPFFSIVGFFLIGVLGFIIQAGNLYLPTGDVEETYVYGNNFSSYHWDYDFSDAPNFNPTIMNDPSTVFLFHKNETKIYEAWDDGNYHFIGFFMMFVGFIAAFFNIFAIGGDD